MLKIHISLAKAFKDAGLNLLSIPGDGDSTLCKIQRDYYTTRYIKRNLLALFDALTISVNHWFFSMSGQHLFPVQDPPHAFKKLMNSPTLLETHVPLLGRVGPNRDIMEVVVRWEIIYLMAEKDPEFLLKSGKSAVNRADKQDPSLVSDISHQYQRFLTEGWFGKGIYLKAIQLFTEAFF